MDWMKSDALSKIELREPREKIRILSHEERERLLEVCQKNSPYLHLLVALALFTGARLMTILELRWKKVNLQRGSITLHDKKDGKRWSVSLDGYFLELMRNYA